MKKLFTILLILITQIGFSQQLKKMVQKADSLFGKENYSDAAKIYLKTANLGDVHSQNRIAHFFLRGWGVDKDTTKSIQYFQKSADQGFAKAQRNLGIIYLQGEVVKRDLKKALHYAELAAKQDFEDTIELLEEINKAIILSQQNSELAIINDDDKRKFVSNLNEVFKMVGVSFKNPQSDFQKIYTGIENSLNHVFLSTNDLKNYEDFYRRFVIAIKENIRAKQMLLEIINRITSNKELSFEEKMELEDLKRNNKNNPDYFIFHYGFDCVRAKSAFSGDVGALKNTNTQEIEETIFYVKDIVDLKKNGKTEYMDLNNFNGTENSGRPSSYIRIINDEVIKLMNENYKDIMDLYLMDANNGNSSIQYELWKKYQFGIGVEKDKKEAFRWLEKSANLKNLEASYEIGKIYDEGNQDFGIVKNKRIAYNYFLQSAMQGDNESQINVANALLLGIGIDKNKTEAMAWIKKATAGDNSKAQFIFGNAFIMFEDLNECEEGLTLLLKSAENGYKPSKSSLYLFYKDGKNCIQKDLEKANKWRY